MLGDAEHCGVLLGPASPQSDQMAMCVASDIESGCSSTLFYETSYLSHSCRFCHSCMFKYSTCHHSVFTLIPSCVRTRHPLVGSSRHRWCLIVGSIIISCSHKTRGVSLNIHSDYDWYFFLGVMPRRARHPGSRLFWLSTVSPVVTAIELQLLPPILSCCLVFLIFS